MPLILWRIKSNDFNNAAVRYRAIYPAYFLRLHHGIESRFITGESWMPVLRQSGRLASAIVFERDLLPGDRKLMRAAKRHSIPVVYDACDNIFAMGTAASTGTIAIIKEEEEAIDRFSFPTHALRNIFIDNGLPAHKCVTIPDIGLDAGTELAAISDMAPKIARHRRPPVFWTTSGWRRPLPPAIDLPPRRAGSRRLVWFGLLVSPYGEAGRELLPPLVPVLNKISGNLPFDLLLVTRNEAVCADIMKDARFDWHFVAWSLAAQWQALSDADLCVLPMGSDNFCMPKSPNRALLALASGLPVVTGPHPAYTEMEENLIIASRPEEWYRKLSAAIAEPQGARAPDDGRVRLEKRFGGRAIARLWASTLGLAE